MKLTPKQRIAVYSMFEGRCAYCGITLPEKGWHADHIEAVNRQTKTVLGPDGIYRYIKTGEFWNPENDHVGNIFPSCRACNIDKSCSSLEGWRIQLQERPSVCRRNYSAFRHAERFGLVVEVKKPVVFWFERKSLDAA